MYAFTSSGISMKTCCYSKQTKTQFLFLRTCEHASVPKYKQSLDLLFQKVHFLKSKRPHLKKSKYHANVPCKYCFCSVFLCSIIHSSSKNNLSRAYCDHKFRKML